LQYLIDYIGADLRIGLPKRFGCKSQSDRPSKTGGEQPKAPIKARNTRRG
jgi:hypothetical protein